MKSVPENHLEIRHIPSPLRGEGKGEGETIPVTLILSRQGRGKILSFPGKVRKTALIMLCVLMILFSTLGHAQDKKFKIGGYIKSYFTVLENPSIDGTDALDIDSAYGIVANTFRLESLWKPSDWFKFELAYAFLPTVGSDIDETITAAFPRPNPYGYRMFDIKQQMYPGSGDSSTVMLRQNLDRFSFTFSAPFADFIFGRQTIAFGTARFINPTDILTPFTFYELDKEERIGVDAARMKIPVGKMSEIDLGYVFGDDFKFSESACFAKLKLYFLETDFSLINIAFKNNYLLGLDLARNIGGASVWFEGAYVFADLLDDYDSDKNYFRFSLGIDYNFPKGLYAFLEYHYNGAGSMEAGKYISLLDDVAYTDGAVYLVGKYYVISGFSYEITPLLVLGSDFILNANDPSIFLSARLDYNVAEDIFLGLGVYLPLGETSELVGATGGTLFENISKFRCHSEFGVYPATYFASARFYF